jgi:hypothetical protein
MKNPNQETLKPSLVRLVSLLCSLEKDGYEVTATGFSKILLGVLDDETRDLTGRLEFGYLPSLGSKRLKMRLHYLVRQGYVAQRYSEADEDYYLYPTDKGLAVASEIALKEKAPKVPSSKHTIRHH